MTDKQKRDGECVKEIGGIKLCYPNFEKFRQTYKEVKQDNVCFSEEVDKSRRFIVDDEIVDLFFSAFEPELIHIHEGSPIWGLRVKHDEVVQDTIEISTGIDVLVRAMLKLKEARD